MGSRSRPNAARSITVSCLAASLTLMPLVGGCSVLTRLDYAHLFTRRGWQRTDRVLATLDIGAGDTVADLGAGEGYWTFHLADAVGPTGRVYAVDVDEEALAAIAREVERRGATNIEIVRGGSAESGLPDGVVDLAFFCNSYHHFDERVEYMRTLRSALRPGARVAVIDAKRDGGAQLFIPKGHALPAGLLESELAQAGYPHAAYYDYLPLQTFDVFRRDPPRE